MTAFFSYFDLFAGHAEPPRPAAPPLAETAPAAMDAAPVPWSGPPPSEPDDGSVLTRTEFGDLGGDGDSFYFFDPDTGSSVML